MAEQELRGRKPVCIAGFVRRPRENKDGSFSFSVVGRRFVLPQKSTFAEKVRKARRVLIQYVEPGRRAADIVLVLENPTPNDIRHYNEM